ncbi:MAG: hypothetical protein A3D92_18430, partial [Bacteroidetes bacterium RIFCSPHIGHO2_02_FULL_44_7]
MEHTRPNILLLSSWYPSDAHPFLGNFVERHAQLLSKAYTVTVVITESRDDGFSGFSDEQKGNIREIRMHYPRSNKLMERRRGMERALTTCLEKISSIDLIIGHVVLQKGLQFVQAKKYFSCPLILVEHGSYFRPEIREKRSWIESLIIRKTRKHLDEVVAVSDFLKKDMQQDFPKHTIRVIGNHIDETLFYPQAKKTGSTVRFLHVSTLDERTKNPEGLLCACRALKDQFNDFHFTFVSDEDFSHWQELAQHFGLENHVSFVGPLSWEAVAPYYYAADAFVLFSNYESFSIVLAEAWATGTPTITTPVG